jgi:Rab GDP dissociation inhibitor
MDETYDAIVLGTGLKECIISGLLSVHNHKVLHIDRNSYYGGESASLNLQQVYEKFRPAGSVPPATLGASRDYNLDLIPKFIMAAGILTKLLVLTGVQRYMEFRVVNCSFVYKGKKIHKVPSSAGEAATSSLMGLFEKNRCKNFFSYCQTYDPNDPKTHNKMDLKKDTAKALFKSFGLEGDTIDFIGHAVALFRDDTYLDEPALGMVLRIQLYWEGIARYKDSPYIYPLYGLGELPQAFARLAAIYGGTYMLNKPIESIVYEGGKAVGVKSEGQIAKCKFVVGDPSYFPDKVKKTGQVVRAIAILSHPIKDTPKDVDSLQLILPAKQTGRKTDMYISVLSSPHCVCPKGKYVAVCAANMEGSADPATELKIALELIAPFDDIIYTVSDLFEPLADGTADNCFISSSMDATSHFETASLDVLSLYKRITGKDVDLTKSVAQTATPGE